MTDLTGRHLIDGNWIDADSTFTSSPLTGPSLTVAEGTAAHVDQAADACFATLGPMSATRHAKLLRAIAVEIDRVADVITAHGTAETGLPEARLIGERGRTTGHAPLSGLH